VASNSIGNQSLHLSTDGKEAKAGLDKFSKQVQDSAKGMNKALAANAGANLASSSGPGIAGGVKAVLGAVGGLIGTYLGGPIGTVIGGLIGKSLGSGLTDAFESLTAPIEHLGELAKINKTASVLGIEPSELQGMTLLLKKAGVEADDVSKVFAIMGKNIAHSLDDTGDKMTAFKRMGIEPEELKSASLTDQFKILADGINRLPRGAQQAQAAMAVFGKSGASLLPILQKGGEGIDEFIEHAKKTGAVLSDEELQRAGDAAKAWKEVKETISHLWEGLHNRMALVAAPFVTMIGKIWSKLLTYITPVFEYVNRILVRLSEIGEKVFGVIGDAIEVAINWIGNLTTELGGFADEWPSVEEVVVKVCKSIAQAAGYVFDAIRFGIGGLSAAIGYVLSEGLANLIRNYKGTFKSVIEETSTMLLGMIELAREWANTMGMKDTAKKLENLNFKIDMFSRKASGDVGGFADKVDKVGQDLMKWGANQVLDFGASPEKIGKWFDSLVFGAKRAKKEIHQAEQAATSADIAKSEAFEKGSKEAYSIEALHRIKGLTDGPAKVEDKILDENKKSNIKLDRLIDAVKDGVSFKIG
jgi:hypothetical protein